MEYKKLIIIKCIKLLKRLFCKHKYIFIENNYTLLGWVRCEYCGKEKYDGSNCGFSHFHLGKFK